MQNPSCSSVYNCLFTQRYLYALTTQHVHLLLHIALCSLAIGFPYQVIVYFYQDSPTIRIVELRYFKHLRIFNIILKTF